MTVYAYRTLYPCGADGVPQSGRRIDVGDRCEVGMRTGAGLWPVTYPAGAGKRSAYLRSIDGLTQIYNQNDYGATPYPAPGYPSATIKSGGCGPTSVAMVVSALTHDDAFGPVASAAFARACGARVSGGTDMGLLSRRAAARCGLTVTTSGSLAALSVHLANGGVAIANVSGDSGKKGIFSTGGHYIVVLGLEGGRMIIADPGLYAGKYGIRYPYRRAAVTVTDKLLRCTPGTLDADCAGRSPKYYLFAR